MKLNLAIVAVLASMGATVAHGAQTWNVTVSNATSANLECPDAGKPDTCLSPTGKTNVFDDGATVTIACVAICTDITLSRENNGTPVSEVKGGAASGTSKVYTLSKADIDGATNVGVFFQRTLLKPFTLAPKSPAPPSNTTTSTSRTFEQVVAASNPMPLEDCPGTIVGRYSDTDDDGEDRETATMYVDVLGNVLAKPSTSFDENDRLTVYVVGDEDLLQRLKVARTSEIRDVTVLRNVGQDQQAPLIDRQSRGAQVCKMRKFDPIDSFAPGKGVVTISRVNGNAVEPIGNFDIAVAPLYSGIFTLGAARTDAVDPKFKLVTNGADQVVAPGDESDKDTVYSIFYTPFVLGKRDLEKPFDLSRWYRHINPTVGLVVDDVSNNFMWGLSIDLPRGVVITVGKHHRKITVLSQESGLDVGSVFTGAADTLPTSEKWESETFVAVSVDIRVMGQLIRNAFTSSTN